MKFLVDVNLGRKFTGLLQDAGHDAVFAKDLPVSSDEEIMDIANEEGMIIITNDKDFGELIFRSGRSSRGVILLRTIATDSLKRFESVKGILDKSSGKFTTVKEGGIRVRKLE